MAKFVTHIFCLDFDKLKKGQIYQSLCGRRYIAEDPPTPEESAKILADNKDSPICKRCAKLKKRH